MRRLLRWFGKARRTFGKLPHWTRDLYGMVSFVNFVELVPTIAAIAFAPRHFFRRLPMTLAGVRQHYQTPVKFFFNFAALFLAVFYMRHGDMSALAERADLIWYLPAIIPLTPPLMIVIGAFTWVLYQVPRLAPNGDAFPAPNPGPFKLLLDPRTYFNLDLARFSWGLFYISVYFLAAWQLAQLAIALNFLGLVHLTAAFGEGHLVPKAILILLGIGLVAFSIHGLVLHPYLEMLRSSLRNPSKAVFATDVANIKQAIQEFLRISSDDPAISDHAETLLATIRSELRRLQGVVAQQNAEFDLTASDLEMRLRVHREAFQVIPLRQHLAYTKPEVAVKFEKMLRRFHDSNDQLTELRQRRAA